MPLLLRLLVMVTVAGAACALLLTANPFGDGQPLWTWMPGLIVGPLVLWWLLPLLVRINILLKRYDPKNLVYPRWSNYKSLRMPLAYFSAVAFIVLAMAAGGTVAALVKWRGLIWFIIQLLLFPNGIALLMAIRRTVRLYGAAADCRYNASSSGD